MGVVAWLDVFLRGNTQSLDSALDKSGKKVQDLKDKAAKGPAGVGALGGALGGALSSLKDKAAKGPAGVGALGGSLSGAIASLMGSLPGGSTVQGMFSGITGGAKGATSVVGMLGGAFAGLAASVVGASVALVAFGLHQMSAIGTSNKMANMLGLSIGSLQALEHQANMSGISAEELHHNLMKMEEGIGDASSKASKALAELGINQSDFKNKNTLEQYTQIEAKMRGIANQGDRLRLAKDMWGKSGAAMANMFDPMKHTLAEAREEAEKLGLILSKEDAGKVSAANRAWKEMKSAITGIGNSLAVELAPAVKGVASSIKDMVIGIRQFMSEIDVETPEWMRYLRSIPTVFMLGMESIRFVFMKIFQSLADLIAKIPGIGDAVKPFADAVGEAAKDQFKDIENRYLELDKILNPVKKPKVPGADRDKEPDKGKSDSDGSDKNKAALAGSVEAFSIIAGDKKDRMYKVANDQLAENKKMVKQLEKMLQKFNGGVKLVKKKL